MLHRHLPGFPLAIVKRSMTSASTQRHVENVWDYPRPPAIELTPRRLRIVWGSEENELTIAETTNAYRILETSHPPTYYFPPKDVKMEWLKENDRHTFCEWKGGASYYDFYPRSPPTQVVKSRIWTYHSPVTKYAALKDHLAFYVGPWRCFVDDEEIKPQEGDFYGGWISSDIQGKMKGGAGTWGW
ncbi:DUF427-domain-containing protein [Rickenella mellea]|uniref:DUF427-domain-containing protein n=1 Tax=Rickenella mellea TaxID=50990 RepID=A0A4Y7QDQ9_9AGAM|nr:DUF427-domain-containing protein [Rickenella mellea]